MKLLDKDMSVHCKVETEGSRTLKLVLMNKNIILRLCGMDKLAKQVEVLYYQSST